MAARIESEKKKTAFIAACENIDTLKVIPERLLQAQTLLTSLRQDEIDTTMLYKCGCPCDWIKESYCYCKEKKSRKQHPKYSNECATCWLYNLTEEVDIPENSNNLEDIIKFYKDFESIKMSMEQLDKILTLLGWKEIYDYGLFLDTIEDMRFIYDKYGDNR